MANMVNELTGQTLRKFDQQTFRKSLTKNASASFAEAGIRYVERRDWDVKTNFSLKKKTLLKKQKEEKNASQASQMEFEDGLKKVREWFVDNWENIEKNVEF
jgi:dTDP-D-glucose 4,6-dehydratase